MRFYMANKFKFIILASLLMVACSHTPARFYLLERLAKTPVEAPPTVSKTLVVGLGPIHMPDYLNRPQLVIAESDHQYRFDDEVRWGEHLEQNVSRVLAAHILHMPGVDQVMRYPWPQRQRIDVQISLDVLSLHHQQGQGTRMKAQWQIRKDDQWVRSQQFECQLASTDEPEAIVASHSQCLAQLAEQWRAFI